MFSPEETLQPFVLAEAERHARDFAPPPQAVDALADADVHEQVLRAIPLRPHSVGLKAQARARLVARAASDGLESLNRAQRQRLLGDAHALRAVRTQVVLQGG